MAHSQVVSATPFGITALLERTDDAQRNG